MYKTLTVLFALGLLALAPLAQAADGKIGVVDVQAVLAQSDAGKAAQARMNAFGEQKRAALDKQQAQLKEERAALQKNASIQTDAAKQQAIKEFQQHVAAFQKAVQTSQQAVAKKSQELLQPLQAELFTVIRNYAMRYGFDLIVDKRAVVYSENSLDLTNEILKAFNTAQANNASQ